MPIYTLPSFSQ